MDERALFISLALANLEPLDFAKAFVPHALTSSLEDEVLKTLFRLGISFHQPVELPDSSNLNWQETVIQCREKLQSRAGIPSEVTSQCLTNGCGRPPPLVFPRARKWVSNSADLGAKVSDPGLTSVWSALRSASHLPSQVPGSITVLNPELQDAALPSQLPSAAKSMPPPHTGKPSPPAEKTISSALSVVDPLTEAHVPAPRQRPLVPSPRKCSQFPPLVLLSASSSPLVPSSSPEHLRESEPPERPRESEPPKRPSESEPPERPRESEPPELPRESGLSERPRELVPSSLPSPPLAPPSSPSLPLAPPSSPSSPLVPETKVSLHCFLLAL